MHWFTNNFLNLGMSLLFPFCKARGMEMRWQCCPAEGIWFTLSQGVQLCPHCCERPRWMPGIGLSAYTCCSGKQICSPCLSAALPFLTGFFPFLFFFFGCAWDMSPARDQTHAALTDLLAGFAEGFAPPCDPGVSNHSSSTVPSPGGLQSAAPS